MRNACDIVPSQHSPAPAALGIDRAGSCAACRLRVIHLRDLSAVNVYQFTGAVDRALVLFQFR